MNMSVDVILSSGVDVAMNVTVSADVSADGKIDAAADAIVSTAEPRRDHTLRHGHRYNSLPA
jgi:hypothetical protein